jgi:ABC-2 type transport system permease protein
VLLGPLVLLLGLTAVLGTAADTDGTLVTTALRTLAILVALTWAFVGLGVLLSSLASTPERAVVYTLLAWVTAVALHDFALIGVLLRWRLPPQIVFALAGINPVELARLGILGSVDPDLSVLGPVGFWLSNTLGPRMTFALAVAWPLLLGTLLLALANRRLRRSDLV